MSWRILTTVIGFGMLAGPGLAAAPLPAMQETPALLEQVQSGALPPVGQRIPEQPRILRRFAGGDGPGQPGGQLNMLVASARDELNQVVFLGLAKPSNNTIMERSELFRPEYASRWTNHDPWLADKLLDEIGLTERDPQGIRLLPDGRPATIVVEYASEETEDIDTLELVADYWRDVGIEMLAKPQTRETLRRRTFLGEAIMTAFEGVVTTVPTADTSPREFAPTTRGALQWSRWGMFVESNGKQGEKCDMERACKLLDDVKEWETTTDPAVRRKAWGAILGANADEVFSIGTVNGIRQPIVVGLKVRNVPKEGYYAWEPGGYIGLYLPDTFWIAP